MPLAYAEQEQFLFLFATARRFEPRACAYLAPQPVLSACLVYLDRTSPIPYTATLNPDC